MDFSRVAFFGDSWVYGSELDNKDKAFPNLLGALNYGVPGTGIPGLLRRFNEAQKEFDIAVFCLTDPSRLMFYKDYDNYTDDSYGNALLDSEYTTLQKISNDYNDDVIVSQVCYILYKWCCDLNIDCFFINMFTRQLNESYLWKLIPDNKWLLPPQSHVVKHLFDRQKTLCEFDDMRDHAAWIYNNNSPDVQKFIRPCDRHPNKLGHKVIAEFISDKLNEI